MDKEKQLLIKLANSQQRYISLLRKHIMDNECHLQLHHIYPSKDIINKAKNYIDEIEYLKGILNKNKTVIGEY